MKIGSHVSNAGELMLLGSVNEAVSNGANALMVYLGAPQNTYRKNASKMQIEAMHNELQKHNISLTDVIIHAPYIVNLAQADDTKWEFAISFLTNEVKLASLVGAKYIVLHPGAHVGKGVDYAINRIATGIKRILANTKDLEQVILLETMAGKGTEIGRTFEEIKAILALVDHEKRMGVCFDTCHVHDAGYDIVNDYDGVKQAFDKIIGLDKIKALHLNDSKNIRGASKDRHENIGFGQIGFETIARFAHDDDFKDIPKILESPYVNTEEGSFSPYKHEIKMLRENLFNPHLIEDIINDK